MRILIRFSKGEEIKYISHLDMQRLFQRALRRAKLPCVYSQGFNPHLNISFACALPLGVCSNAEYVEFQLEKYVHPETVKYKLNEVLPTGVRVLEAVEPKDSFPNVGSVISFAEYTFEPTENDGVEEKLKALTDLEEIVIEKRTKKGMSNVNVRPLIYKLRLENNIIAATLACSNSENLRADKLVDIMLQHGIKAIHPCRTSIYIINEGKLTEPLTVKQ